MDITLRKLRTFRVSGKVVGSPGGRRGGQVMLRKAAEGEPDTSYSDRLAAPWNQATGAFEIRAVPPGSYILRAEQWEGNDSRLSARVRVDVGQGNVEGVVAQLQPAIEVRGSIRVDPKSDLNPADLSVSLGGGGPGSRPARVQADSSFAMKNVTPDRYQVTVTGLPAGHYLKSVRLNETDVLAMGLDLSQTGSLATGLDVVISPKGASVDGTVNDEKGNPMKGAVVVATPPFDHPGRARLTRTATAGDSGQYSFQGLAPGTYLLFAFEDVDPGEAQDPDFLKPRESAAVKATLNEAGQETKGLKAMGLEP